MKGRQNLLIYYINEYFRWRLLKVVVLSAISSLFILMASAALASCNPLSLLIWSQGILYSMFQLKVWLFEFVLVICVVVLILFNERKFSVTSCLHTKRLDLILHLLQPMNVIHIGIYCLMSLLSLCFLVQMLRNVSHYYQVDSADVDRDGDGGAEEKKKDPDDWVHFCISRKFGLTIILGLLVFIKHISSGSFYLQFSILQLPKILKLKISLKELLSQTLHSSLTWLLVLHPINHFVLEPFAMHSFDGFVSKSDFEIYEKNRSMWNIHEIIFHYVYIVSIHLILSVPLHVHSVFVTEPLEFPIIPKLAADDLRCLSTALKFKQKKLIQYLALLDLRMLSEFSKSRRHELFSLSTPGFHPIYWQSITDEILKELEVFSSKINGHLDEIVASNMAGSVLLGLKQQKSNFGASNSGCSGAGLGTSSNFLQQQPQQQPQTPPKCFTSLKSSMTPTRLYSSSNNVTSPFNNSIVNNICIDNSNSFINNNNNNVIINNKVYNNNNTMNVNQSFGGSSGPRLRNASENYIHPQMYPKNDTVSGSYHYVGSYAEIVFSAIRMRIVAILDVLCLKLLNYLSDIWLVRYFFNESVELKNLLLFQESQKYIWIVQSLSMLASHSYKEDEFGVVQGSLANILNKLLVLHEALSRPIQLPALSTSSSSSSSFLRSFWLQRQVIAGECRMRRHLRNETKAAVYRVVCSFPDCVKNLDLPYEHVQKLQHFLEFKE
ncbi:hypothetical protein HELRODRAFT_192051 [Helobdella robusta]|uniref:Nucleoporin NDC1 n=1 Tax=Helobdella robusta TaxID=6412 RepID=T1FTJ6_HELRO|nr:hypothetical protein HELRODRAFT_192051 [Helobdella robusta]ESO03466.1 hypothetical protein HELRODRAFT_192051 [Helobdella robusta]